MTQHDLVNMNQKASRCKNRMDQHGLNNMNLEYSEKSRNTPIREC